MQKKKRYAGIGSRRTPIEILGQMTMIASFMETQGYILYSGGADGADKAFENGVLNDNMKKIFLPWSGFNKNTSSYHTITKESLILAERFHPSWESLPDTSKRLIARNGYQILDEELSDPIDMVICYTPNGKPTGGTGQALRIANRYNIPVFNLYFKNKLEEILFWIKSNNITFMEKMEIQSWNLM